MLERNNNPLKKVTLFVTTEFDPTKIDFDKIENALIGSLTWIEGVGKTVVSAGVEKAVEDFNGHSRLYGQG